MNNNYLFRLHHGDAEFQEKLGFESSCIYMEKFLHKKYFLCISLSSTLINILCVCKQSVNF